MKQTIPHWSFIKNNALFVSLDVETGGTHFGIVQLSAELFRLVHLPGAKNNQQPTIVRLWDTFDAYVNPG